MKFFKHLCIALVLVLITIAAGTLLPRPIVGDKSDVGADTSHRILILSNPIHTDIALPVDAELLARFGFLREGLLEIDNPGVRYLVFGWGGRAFYTQTPTWADLKPMPVLKSLTLDGSVMHVAMTGDLSLADESVTNVALSGEGYQRLLDFIMSSFAQSQGKQVPLPGTAYGPYDAFFEAVGGFNVLLGCNTWTAATLRHAGVRTGWWTPLPPLLTASMRLHNTEVIVQSAGTTPL